jgi:hypothetical protein
MHRVRGRGMSRQGKRQGSRVRGRCIGVEVKVRGRSRGTWAEGQHALILIILGADIRGTVGCHVDEWQRKCT